MKENRPSITALGIAATRAIESERPAEARICYDPYARRFVGAFMYHFMKFWVDIGYGERIGPGTFGFLVCRDRYIDDYLERCLEDGVTQVVILGAGYDSRAYRYARLKTQARVYEVDHPATQRVKIAKLAHILGALPPHVVFVAIDFASESLEARLFAAGYDPAQKTAFIWQGVTQYLTPAAVDETLAFVTAHAGPGSSIVFDYMDATTLREGRRGEVKRMRRYRRFTGEGLTFGIPLAAADDFLRARGFTCVQNATADALQRLYCVGANAGRTVAPGYGILSGVVGPGEEEPFLSTRRL